MLSPDVFAMQRSGFSDFLFESVGSEPNGMPLTLISLFARRGTDPWNEAGRLAALPTPDAIDSLTRAMDDVPATVPILPDAKTLATRLIGLLPSPRSAASDVRLAATSSARQIVQSNGFMRIALLIACAVLGMAYTMGAFSSQDSAKTDGNGGTPYTSSAAPPPPQTGANDRTKR